MIDVADHVGRTRPEVGGPHGCGYAPKTLRLPAAFLVAGLLTASTAIGAATEFVVPGGPVITLQDGQSIDGHIVGIDQTNVIILTADDTRQTLPRSTLENVTFETVTGRKLVGELVGWTKGVYQIATSEAAIKVYSTMPAPSANATVTASEAVLEEATEETADTTVDDRLAEETGPAQDAESAEETGDSVQDAGQGSSQAIAAVSVEEGTDGVAGNADATATPTANLRIQVSVENSRENGPPVAFNIALSEPSESSVVLIYATIDGTAVDGKDYEASRGVLIIKPGEQTARIEATVLDDADSEGQENLKLFLTVDPTVAVVENRQIIATIDDDDQG